MQEKQTGSSAEDELAQEALSAAADAVDSCGTLPSLKMPTERAERLLPHLLLVLQELCTPFMLPLLAPMPGISDLQEAFLILVGVLSQAVKSQAAAASKLDSIAA